MSTRASIFLHEDPNTGVTIHIYDECVGIDTPCGLRLEIEHAHGVTNVAWPLSAQSTALLEGLLRLQ